MIKQTMEMLVTHKANDRRGINVVLLALVPLGGGGYPSQLDLWYAYGSPEAEQLKVGHTYKVTLEPQP